MAKAVVALLLLPLFVLLTLPALAQVSEGLDAGGGAAYPFRFGLTAPKSAPELTTCTSVGRCILLIFSFVFKILIWIAGAAAVIALILAGINYIGKPEEAQRVHARIVWALVGIAVALASFAVVRIIEATLTRGFAMMPIAYAQTNQNPLEQFRPPSGLAGIPGCNPRGGLSIFGYLRGQQVPSGLLGSCTLGLLGLKILPFVYTVILLLSVGQLIVLGYLYATSGGQVANLHQRLLWSIIGVMVAVLAFSAVKALEISLTVPESLDQEPLQRINIDGQQLPPPAPTQ